MDRIIHYTSNRDLNKILESGILLPRSNPLPGSDDHDRPFVKLSDRVRSLIKDDLYLVGVQKHLDDGWVEYGLIEYLLQHTTGEVVLSVPILDKQRCLVRDHVHLSPKRFADLYGEDLWKKLFEGQINPKDDPRLIEAANKYVESTIPLDEYDGSYFVPEIWLAQKTPVAQLTRLY